MTTTNMATMGEITILQLLRRRQEVRQRCGRPSQRDTRRETWMERTSRWFSLCVLFTARCRIQCPTLPPPFPVVLQRSSVSVHIRRLAGYEQEHGRHAPERGQKAASASVRVSDVEHERASPGNSESVVQSRSL